MKKYTVDYFIRKFIRIPSRKWGTGNYKSHGRCCAFGHCGVHTTPEGEDIWTEEGFALLDLTDRCYDLAKVNDCEHENYNQNSAKLRVLTCLADIKDGKI